VTGEKDRALRRFVFVRFKRHFVLDGIKDECKVRQSCSFNRAPKGGACFRFKRRAFRAGVGAQWRVVPLRRSIRMVAGRYCRRQSDTGLFSGASRHACAMKDNHTSQNGSQNFHDCDCPLLRNLLQGK